MTRKKIYTTNLVIAIGFTVIAFYKSTTWLYAIPFAVLAATLINYNAAKFIAKSWITLGKTIGNVNAKILLTIFYFLMLVPLALIKKIFGKRVTPSTQTNWITVTDNINFKNPF